MEMVSGSSSKEVWGGKAGRERETIWEGGLELATAQVTGARLLELLRSFMTKGEILSMRGPEVFLPVGPSICPLCACGCSKLRFRERWASK